MEVTIVTFVGVTIVTVDGTCPWHRKVTIVTFVGVTIVTIARPVKPTSDFVYSVRRTVRRI